MAASATFALNAELCVRRARLAIVTPDLRHSRRLQAEAPLIDLSEFGQPALTFSRVCSRNSPFAPPNTLSSQFAACLSEARFGAKGRSIDASRSVGVLA